MSRSITLSEALLAQAERLAQHLNISSDHLIEIAVERFIDTHAHLLTTDADAANPHRAIQQGDLYWVQFASPDGLEAGIAHPHVVIQDDVLNHSRIATVVVCALTTNQSRASMPGNVVLDAGEAHLPKRSIVEVSKVSSISKAQLGGYIGSLSGQRVQQILAGMQFVQRSFLSR